MSDMEVKKAMYASGILTPNTVNEQKTQNTSSLLNSLYNGGLSYNPLLHQNHYYNTIIRPLEPMIHHQFFYQVNQNQVNQNMSPQLPPRLPPVLVPHCLPFPSSYFDLSPPTFFNSTSLFTNTASSSNGSEKKIDNGSNYRFVKLLEKIFTLKIDLIGSFFTLIKLTAKQ